MLISALGAACSDDGAGQAKLAVRIDAEDVIVDGLPAGEDSVQVADGWQVDFDRYLVTVGKVELRLSTDHAVRSSAGDVFIVDLTRVPSGGLELWTLADLQAGRWEFHYRTPRAPANARRHRSVDTDVFERMVDERWTYWVSGSLRNADGRSCPPQSLATPQGAEPNGENLAGDDCYAAPVVQFDLGAAAETHFGPCEVDGLSGVAVTEGATQSVSITIHGDHLFFNGFPEGDEGSTRRLAQWLADCDLDLDGRVTTDELGQISPDVLAEFDTRFALGGSPITPLDSMLTYVAAQLKTQGHYQGEGECAR
jgi:hypothetical protein